MLSGIERRNGSRKKRGLARGLTDNPGSGEDAAVRSRTTDTRTCQYRRLIDNNDGVEEKQEFNLVINMVAKLIQELTCVLTPDGDVTSNRSSQATPPFSTHTLPNHQVGFTTEVRMRRALLIARLKL
ncbi:hypothetical protein CEXT_16781 [Caerostris extrusa]|uniref:Uncharacterized protein n=1 Tax=Caerostris extrusa TaxID=172846 RepID=A0AAV4NT14_CAEEX|nr:hypothetical protein CEXT_16781 [Caerostris extrusa]